MDIGCLSFGGCPPKEHKALLRILLLYLDIDESFEEREKVPHPNNTNAKSDHSGPTEKH